MDLQRLRDPFPSKDVEWRITNTNKDKTKGMIAAYVDARAIMDRLDEVCGPENWQVEYRHEQTSKGSAVIARLGIYIDGGALQPHGWIWKEDGADQTDTEPIKGGISSALRRAGVPWGIARYLYNLPNQWVAIETRGNASYIAEGVTPRLPDWALPENERGNRRAQQPSQQERPPEPPQQPVAPRNEQGQGESPRPPLPERLGMSEAVQHEGWMKEINAWLKTPAVNVSWDSPVLEDALGGRAITEETAAGVIQSWMDETNGDLGKFKTAVMAAKRGR